MRVKPAQAIKTTCPYCGVGCGVVATEQADGAVTIKGDPDHPANRGRLCSKGSALGETLELDGRLTFPMLDGHRATWDSALERVANGFAQTIKDHGPDSVAFYVSGQLLTEDYYVANKLMKGFIGSANIDTNSRLCMASSVAGHKRAFGSDTVPGCYDDIEHAEVVVLVGSNLAWCHPILFQRLVAARQARGTKIVVVDPRRTATCESADLYLGIVPGADVALFNGLLTHLNETGALDTDFIGLHTNGFSDAIVAAADFDLEATANITGLSQVKVRAFFDLFAANQRVVTIYSQGVNQSTAGTDKVNAIINCHLATGRIGKPGMGPFSVTGQPNAMGGREVGGLANMLAAHMELADPDHRRIVKTFWNSPRIASHPGLKAVDMFRAVGDGRIKAIWIIATNPVVSLPEADSVRAALKRCPLVVVSDVEQFTDTTALAHVLLPSAAWGEKSGTVTNSERCISRQRKFLETPSEAKPDWWQLAEVARRMGFASEFAWNESSEIFAEYAAMTGTENAGNRDLDISAFDNVSQAEYEALEPFQWPKAKQRQEQSPSQRFFADGQFFTPDRRARFIPVRHRVPVEQANAEWPLVLNTGRIRDQWHTMTRTARSPRLMSQMAEPFIEIHPDDGAAFKLQPAALVCVTSVHGAILLRTVLTANVKPGTVFVPFHWSGPFASNARVGALLGGNVDPVSGQPELKHGRVRVVPFDAQWHGFATSVAKPSTSGIDYWAVGKTTSGWRVELAGSRDDFDAAAALRRLWPHLPATCDTLAYQDRARGEYRFVVFDGATLVAALYLSVGPVACARQFICDQIGKEIEGAQDRLRLLAGRPAADVADAGPIVCACFNVGRNVIVDAIHDGARTIDAVGLKTCAGTNCGSCRPEIGGLLNATRIAKAV
jgi:assimilatory nitrate reductase catalytic subunit